MFITWDRGEDVDADDEADDGEGTADQSDPTQELVQQFLKIKHLLMYLVCFRAMLYCYHMLVPCLPSVSSGGGNE